MSNIPQTLTIAGSDSGGGAGIQADLKTFQMQGVFGTSVITAVTAQNTLGVFDIHPIPLKTIQAQLEAVKNDFQIASAKIGMLGTADIIECVADFLKKSSIRHIGYRSCHDCKRWCAIIATTSGIRINQTFIATRRCHYPEYS